MLYWSSLALGGRCRRGINRIFKRIRYKSSPGFPQFL
jgi:hypothetical protein